MNLRFHLLKVGHCAHPECVAMRGGSWRSVQFPALCGLLEHPTRGPILFDTGYSSHFTNATEPFPERFYRWTTPFTLPAEESLEAQLAQRGFRLADIGNVIVSHVHGDHIAGLRDLPAARFIALRAEVDALREKSRIAGLMHGVLPALLPPDFGERLVFADDLPSATLPAQFKPFERGFDLFGDGSIIGVPLPGHSRGQMGIAFQRGDGAPVFMVADACWSRKALANGQEPTWLASRIFDSRARYGSTFRQLRTMAAQPQSPMVVPSHCEQTWKAQHNESD